MKKSITTVFIAVATMLVLCMCLVACSGSRTKEPYTAYEITGIEIRQQGSDLFDYVVESDIAPSLQTKVYITRYDDVSADAQAIEYVAVDGKYSFSATVSYATYYLHIVEGEKSAVMPMTRPQMAPTLTTNKTNAIVTYNFANGTSWSSFCDPTGKSIYKSNKLTFDDTAVLVAQNVNISGVESTTDTAYTTDLPYYYVVLSAKNGIVKYISAPIMKLAQAYRNVRVDFETVEGKARLKVSGKFVTDGDVTLVIYSADEKLGRVAQLLGNEASGKAGDAFVTYIDLSKVYSFGGSNGKGIWYDIKLASGYGTLYDINMGAANTSDTVKEINVTYEFKTWNSILKLNYNVYDYAVTSVIIEESGDKAPELIIKGVYNDELTDIKLHGDVQANGTQTKEIFVDNASLISGEFEFRMSLADIPTEGKPWCWFHIYTYKNNASVATNKDELPRGEALTIEQTFEYGDVIYTIKAYQNVGSQLAIQAEAK